MEEKHVMKKIINFVAAGGIAAAPSLTNYFMNWIFMFVTSQAMLHRM